MSARPALSHFTNHTLEAVHSVEQPVSQQGWPTPYKPKGLWVSVDGEDDWKSWCEENDYGCGSKRYRIVLKREREREYFGS